MQQEDQVIGGKNGLHFGPLGENWAHICVDMQRMFRDDTPWRASWMPRVLPLVVHLVEAGPERTVFTRFIPPRSAQEAWGTWRRYYARWPMMTREQLDETLIEVAPELVRFVPPAKVHDKAVYSPWLDGALHAHLARSGINTLVISGTETEVCVLATVLGAIDRGYRVVVATDAVCSSADPTHDAMLEIYHSRFGMQVEAATVGEILEAL